MKRIAEGVALFRKFAVYEASGTVLKETTRSETETTGTIGNPDQMAHRVAPYMPRRVKGKIKSRTTRYQTIHLKGDDGRDVIELVDFVVPCVEGDEASFWRIDDSGWIAATNRSTKSSYRRFIPAAQALFPWREYLGLSALLAFPLWLGMRTSNPGDTGFAIFAAIIAYVIAGALLFMPASIAAAVRARIALRLIPN